MGLIDADELKWELETELEYQADFSKYWRNGMKYAIKHIDIMPTIDAVEVKQGVWLNMFGKGKATGMYDGICSVCGEESECLTRYCGSCGAKMTLKVSSCVQCLYKDDCPEAYKEVAQYCGLRQGVGGEYE